MDTTQTAQQQNAPEPVSQDAGDETPLVSFLVPCYNSADYMERCISSLLNTRERCELIIVNDGSTDATLEVARKYEERYDYVRVIDQENSNWGGGVNNGLAIARGHYFKVVDSDDWLERKALDKVLVTLRKLLDADEAPDLLLTNYMYVHALDSTQRIMSYSNIMPANTPFTWKDVGKARLGQYLMIHASWYRTQILRDSGVVLPTGVCYMDSMLLLHPMPLVKNLYYLDVNAYHYFVGRDDQSINIEVVKKRIDQQLLATRLAIDDYDMAELTERNPKLAECMMRYICCMMSVSTTHLFMINTPESLEKNRELWEYMEEKNPVLYRFVRRTIAGASNRKTALGRKLVLGAHKLAQKIYKFA